MTRTQKWIVTSCIVLAMLFAAVFMAVGTGPLAHADDGLEIVSVGGKPVLPEPEDGMFDNGSFPMGWVGIHYSAQLVAQGGSGNYTWDLTLGSLADGLSFNEATGVVSGTPTDTATGSIGITVNDNDSGKSDYVNLGFIVADDDWVPAIGTTSLSNAIVGDSYYEGLELSAFSEIFGVEWTCVEGDLPDGLQLGNEGRWNGLLSGTPTEAGTFTFTLKAENEVGYDEQEYTIQVDERMTLSYPEGCYYCGDEVQITASIGNEKVDWSVYNTTSPETKISESGKLTIGADEDGFIYVYAQSKTNLSNYKAIDVDYTHGIAYSITIIGGEAKNSIDDVIAREAAEEDVSISAPDLEGKRFREWTIETGSAEVVFGDRAASNTYFVMPAGDVILKANYDTVIYEVSASFDTPVNGQHVDKTLATGSANYTATLKNIWVGAGFGDLDEMVYETGREYIFYVEFTPVSGYVLLNPSELSVKINGNSLSVDENYYYSEWNITLTAVTDEIPLFSVDVVNGIANSTLAEEGTVITITANEPAEGYVFDKWTSDDVTFANERAMETTFALPAKNVTVRATYKAIPQYTVSFDENGGSGSMLSAQVNEGANYVLPSCLFVAPTNQEFKCWSVNESEKNVGDAFVVNANTTVKAVWKYIVFTISFDENGGTGSMAPQQANKGSEYVLPAATFTAPAGMEFKCWSVKDANIAVGGKVVVNEDLTIKAIWQEATITPDPEAPTSDPEAPTGDPEAPASDPEAPASDPETPIGGSGSSTSDHETAVGGSESSATESGTEESSDSADSEASESDAPAVADTEVVKDAEVKAEEKGGLSGGAIAGIVIGSVFGALIIACIVFVILHKKGIVNIPLIDRVIAKISNLFAKKKDKE